MSPKKKTSIVKDEPEIVNISAKSSSLHSDNSQHEIIPDWKRKESRKFVAAKSESKHSQSMHSQADSISDDFSDLDNLPDWKKNQNSKIKNAIRPDSR